MKNEETKRHKRRKKENKRRNPGVKKMKRRKKENKGDIKSRVSASNFKRNESH